MPKLNSHQDFINLVQSMVKDEEFKGLLKDSAEPARSILNALPSFHENACVQSLSALSASIALTKRDNIVSKEEFFGACEIIWATQTAVWEKTEETKQ